MFNEFKKLLKHSLIYGAGAVISKAVGFLMIPVYTRYLTPEDYGILEILTLTSFIITWIFSMGLDSSILRFYFDYDTEKEKKQVISTGLIFLIGVMLLGTSILLNFVSKFSLIFLDTVEYSHYFRIIFITTFFQVILNIPLTYLRAKDQSVLFVAISLCRLIIALSLNIYLIVFLNMGVLGVLYSSLITSSFICVIMLFIIFKEIGFVFSLNKLKKMLDYGLPFIPTGLSLFELSFADRYFLKCFSSLKEVGLYSLGYKFASMLGILIINPFIQIWNVFMFPEAKKNNAKQIFARVLTYFGFILTFAGLGISILGEEIVKIVAAPNFFDSYKVIPIVSLAYILYGGYHIFPIGIYLKKKTKHLVPVVISAAILNLLLNWLLIPKFNMMGAGMATMLSYLYLATCTHFVSLKFYYIHYEFRRISKILLTAIFLYACSLLINTQILYSILLKGLLWLSFPVLLYFLKFYEKNELYKFKKLLSTTYSKIKLGNIN